MVIETSLVTLWGAIAVLVHGLGILNAAHAVMTVRSSRGAVAWVISLITFPWLAIPLYWILGRKQFQGYSEVLRSAYLQHRELIREASGEIAAHRVDLPSELDHLEEIVRRISPFPFTDGNSAQVLVDGAETFASLKEAIAAARSYILFQFYIIQNDDLGNEFRRLLIEKAQQGVRIHVLFDEVGSKNLSREYIRSLERSEIRVSAFHTTRGWKNRFQLNFRNHRKIVVIDGIVSFVGGLNIGDEYLGRHPTLSPWRDTHLMLRGTATQCLQRVFLADWYWATRELPEVDWTVHPADEDEIALILPTGPADSSSTCPLFYSQLMNQAQHRLWMASPYLVPDDSTLNALKLASLRGVDVRILLPNHPDHLMVYLAAFSFYSELLSAGVKIYRYQPGFMHQKIILVDEVIAGVGTVNLDNRSFYLNFEVMAFGTSDRFIRQVETMLTQDLELCCKAEVAEYEKRSLPFRLVVRVTRLLSPIL